MADLIDKQKASEPNLGNNDSICTKTGLNDEDRTTGDCISRKQAIDALCELPSIDAVKHGRWKYISFLTVECSECKTQIHDLEYFNFCPSCGARMDAERKES